MNNRIFLSASMLLTVATLGCFALIVATPAFAHQSGGGGNDYTRPIDDEGFHARGPGNRLERLAEVLELNDAQRAQIEQIVTNERTANATIREQLQKNRAKLRALAESAVFDEAAVRAVATEQARQRIELMVAHARTRHAINALLTPTQRELAERLRPLFKHGKKGRRGPDSGPYFDQK